MKKNVIGRAGTAFALVGALALAGCSGSSAPSEDAVSSVLDPSDPEQVELWTYYNGTQQQAFEDLVKDFNATKGKDLGIVVTSSSQGGVNDLASAVTDSAQELVGSEAMPDAFLSYSDTSSVIDGFGMEAELSIEGIVRVAERYYEWTDAQTPGVMGDGRPFFGRDAMANYLITGSKQLGHEIFEIENGVCALNFDRATMKTLWDNYYVPMVQGWFSAEGKFRSDAVKTGDLICYVGSSSSVVYFPQTVTVDDATSYPIQLDALPNPSFEHGKPCSPQQGAGFVVTKSDEKKETACVEFLKWFTAKEQNTDFSVSAGYVPVTKDALTLENLQAAAESIDGASGNYLVNLPATLDTIEAGVYANPPFKGGVEARAVLDRALSDRAVADRAAVVEAMAAGASSEEAVAPYLDDAGFDAWLADLETQLREAIA